MIGTIINAAAILFGGILGLSMAQPWTAKTQLTIKFFLGVITVFVGLKMSFASLGGSFGDVFKQLLILVLALALGRLIGRALHLQKLMNHAGKYAQEQFAKVADSSNPQEKASRNQGFLTCSLLFCLAPLAVIGAVQDGLNQQWQPLAVKAVMDGLATMSFVTVFGWSSMLSVVPVVALQGTITLSLRLLEPMLLRHELIDSIHGIGGMLVFCVALIILEFKKIELGDYLPALAVAPLLTWLWR